MKIKLKLHSLIFIICLFILSLCLLGNYSVKADSGPGISVIPEYPKEQIQKNGIFNVIFKSNQHYNLAIKVANTSNTDKNVTISPNTAYTSNSGSITFDKSNATSNTSKEYDFRSLFNQKEKKITIPSNTISQVNFGLKMPSDSYKGIILGGFYITISNENKSNVKSNFTINNKFSYALAAAIHNNKEKYEPKIQLGNIISNNNNNQMLINSNLKNITSGIISGMNVKSTIIKDSNNEIISKTNRNNLSMAPNSSFNYENAINSSLSPGNYKVKLNITDDNGHTWQKSKDFKVNTREYITHFTKQVPWTLYVLIGTIILLAIVIIFLVYYYQFKNKKNNK